MDESPYQLMIREKLAATQQVADMRASGMTLDAIGEAIGRSRERVRQLLNQHNNGLIFQRRYAALRELISVTGPSQELLATPFDEIYFPVTGLNSRIHQALSRNDIKSLADVTHYTFYELLRLPNLGRKSMTALVAMLSDFGLSLADQRPAPPLPTPPEIPKDVADVTMNKLEWSVRVSNCLRAEGIVTIRELVTRSETDLLRLPYFGKTSLREVKMMLNDLGLELAKH
jgi:hypothetical protein